MRLLLAAIACILPMTVAAHDYVAKDGRVITWYNNNGCCNGKDCRPVEKHAGTTPAGDLIVLTDDGLTIVVPKAMVRKTSRDAGEHVCAKSIETGTNGTAHCIFVPTEVRMTPRALFAALERDLTQNICKRN